MEREACVCDHGFEKSDLCAEIIIIIIIIISVSYQTGNLHLANSPFVVFCMPIRNDGGYLPPLLDSRASRLRARREHLPTILDDAG